MRGNDISERLLEFAARILRTADAMPQSPSGKHISLQLVQSGTSAGANYEEACAAESKRDFIHKLGICLKELRETRYWLRIVEKGELAQAERMTDILKESDELCRLIGKSIVTAKQKEREKQTVR
jgi:four helix bundle protein